MPDARYRMEYPPIETAKNATKVFISLDILELGSFKELQNTYTAKIALELRLVHKKQQSNWRFLHLESVKKIKTFQVV